MKKSIILLLLISIILVACDSGISVSCVKVGAIDDYFIEVRSFNASDLVTVILENESKYTIEYNGQDINTDQSLYECNGYYAIMD